MCRGSLGVQRSEWSPWSTEYVHRGRTVDAPFLSWILFYLCPLMVFPYQNCFLLWLLVLLVHVYLLSAQKSRLQIITPIFCRNFEMIENVTWLKHSFNINKKFVIEDTCLYILYIIDKKIQLILPLRKTFSAACFSGLVNLLT